MPKSWSMARSSSRCPPWAAGSIRTASACRSAEPSAAVDVHITFPLHRSPCTRAGLSSAAAPRISGRASITRSVRAISPESRAPRSIPILTIGRSLPSARYSATVLQLPVSIGTGSWRGPKYDIPEYPAGGAPHAAAPQSCICARAFPKLNAAWLEGAEASIRSISR